VIIMDEIKFKSLVNRRTTKINKRAEKFNQPPISKEIIEILFRTSIDTGLKCSYCGEKMELFASKGDFRMAISIDHIIPFTSGGKNTEDNMRVCCTRCNLVKSIMPDKDFIFILNAFEKEHGKDKMISWLDQLFNGMLANKIDRLKNEEY